MVRTYQQKTGTLAQDILQGSVTVKEVREAQEKLAKRHNRVERKNMVDRTKHGESNIKSILILDMIIR